MKCGLICLTIVITATALARVSRAQPPDFVLGWGSRGSEDGQFDLPRRLAVDNDGNVFVSDRNNHRIQKFTGDGEFLMKWGTLGSGDGQFDFPFGIDVDSDGNVYVAERNNNRVQKFSNDGEFLTKWGVFGSGDGQFNFPVAVAVGPNGYVYVGDAFNHRIQRFTAGGGFLSVWGSLGTGDGQFNFPIGIAVDQSGNVYVGDSGNNRVQKFTSSGIFVTKWGSEGTGEGEFNSPRGIGIDTFDHVYVSDFGNSRIQQFTTDGTFVTAWGVFGAGEGEFNRPEDVDADPAGNVFVADSGNNRIQKFAYSQVPVTLTRLVAERSGQPVRIRWWVAEPLAHAVAFHVYRSVPGSRDTVKERITREPIRGRLEYEFIDESAPHGETDYWIEEIAEGGVTYLHGPITAPEAPHLPLILEHVSPNPFNPQTRIAFSLPEAAPVRLSVHDANGRLVAELIDDTRPEGEYRVWWDATDGRGRLVASGTYFVRLEAAGRIESRKVTVLR